MSQIGVGYSMAVAANGRRHVVEVKGRLSVEELLAEILLAIKVNQTMAYSDGIGGLPDYSLSFHSVSMASSSMTFSSSSSSSRSPS